MMQSIHLVVLLWALISVPGPNAAERKIDKTMDTQSLELPFKLKPRDLLKVEVQCEYLPAALNTWSEAIHISGATGITLLLAKPGVSKPDSLQARQNPQALIALLQYFEDCGFMEMEDDTNPTKKDPLIYLGLSIPGQANRVFIGGKQGEILNQLFGAVKMTAGVSVHGALDKKFLPHL